MSFCCLLIRNASYLKPKTPKFGMRFALTELRNALQKPQIESFDLILKFGLDPTNGEHMIRGNCFMPSGIGAKHRIAVFIPEEHKQLAIDLGASIAGDELLKQINEGKFEFDQVLATADMFDTLKPLARTLGTRGLMPTTRNNTLISFDNLEMEMKKFTKGVLKFKMNKLCTIQAAIGKCYLTEDEILANFKAFITSIDDAKPRNLKQKYIKKAFLSTTYGKSYQLDLNTIDIHHFRCEFP